MSFFQCIPHSWICDGKLDCISKWDEDCHASIMYRMTLLRFTTSTGIVVLDKVENILRVEPAPVGTAGFVCPDTHFQCRSVDLCLPVYMRCNQVYDCEGREDEAGCQANTCPGFIRCKASSVCLHPSHVCDGVIQCPRLEDELFCKILCHDSCTCYGRSFFCDRKRRYPASFRHHVRYLLGDGSGLTLADVGNLTLLTFFSIADCNVTNIHRVLLPNLLHLDLTDNDISSLPSDSLHLLPNLRELILKKNLISFQFIDNSLRPVKKLQTLDLSEIPMTELNVSILKQFPSLVALNLSQNQIEHLTGGGFQALGRLKTIDLRGCQLRIFLPGLFAGLGQLHTVYTDNFRLCCSVNLPAGFNPSKCQAPADPTASCGRLISSKYFHIFLAASAAAGLVGNCACFTGHLRSIKRRGKESFYILVLQLNLADLLSGVYAAILVAADDRYRGQYALKDDLWRDSAGCTFAGVSFMIVNAMSTSALALCSLYCTDLVHVFRGRPSAVRWCVTAWCFCLTYALVPSLPQLSHWKFYRQSVLCLPLVLEWTTPAGHYMAAGIMFNFIMSLFIFMERVLQYLCAQNNKSIRDTKSNLRHRHNWYYRIELISLTHCLYCSIVAGVLIYSPADTIVNGITLMVLPVLFRSALSPLLYTLAVVMRRRKEQRRERLFRLLRLRIKDSNAAASADTADASQKAWEQFTSWIADGLLSPDVARSIAEHPAR